MLASFCQVETRKMLASVSCSVTEPKNKQEELQSKYMDSCVQKKKLASQKSKKSKKKW